ncbi:MAG: hypothetical protein LBR06_01300 [Bacteroidales bacterium]|jgi:hypothetical protein|nr:hypothetical protein [Bacteroidales bacterium]
MKKLLYILLLGVFAASCSKEIPVGEEDNRRITLLINIPSEKTVSTRSGDMSDECVVNSLDIFVMANGVLQYYTQATDISAPDANLKTTCTAWLRKSATQQQLIVVANRTNHDTYYPMKGTTIEALKANLCLSYPGAGIPMYGEALVADIAADDALEINMLRALSRIDVHLQAGVNNFVMNELYAYRAANKYRIIADNVSNIYTAPVATQPTLEPSTTFNVEVGPVTTAATTSTNQLYLPESAGVTAPAQQLSNATCIVVGGLYNGQQNYYRLDFEVGSYPFGQILRNFRYDFVISSVASHGWTTPEEAASNKASGLTVTVQPWNLSEKELLMTPDSYFKLSNRTVKIAASANSIRNIDVDTNIDDYRILWKTDYDAGLKHLATDSLQNANFKVVITNSGKILNFRALSANTAMGDKLDSIVVIAAQWVIPLYIHQEDMYKFLNKDIYCYSLAFNEYGSFTGRFKQKLENTANFGPSGTIKVGSLITENHTTNSGTTWNSYVAYSNLSKYDILWLGYDRFPTAAQAQTILQWLRDRPNRVLIINSDSNDDNTQIHNLLNNGLKWVYGGSTNNFNVIFSEATKKFTNGPFGDIAPGATILRRDNIFGRTDASGSPHIIQLTTHDNGMMVVGIDPTSRIIYLGDGDIFADGRSGMSSGANVEPNNASDVFAMNLFAWIVDIVLQNSN